MSLRNVETNTIYNTVSSPDDNSSNTGCEKPKTYQWTEPHAICHVSHSERNRPSSLRRPNSAASIKSSNYSCVIGLWYRSSVTSCGNVISVYHSGAAAALVSNPILLQLGVITGKKRRRRDSDADVSSVSNLSEQQAEAVQQKLNEIALLERFMAQVNSLMNTSFQEFLHTRAVPKVMSNNFL